jgi:hypothetical protein
MPKLKSVSYKAHCFWVDPSPESIEGIDKALRSFADRKGTTREIETKTETYKVCEPSWRVANNFQSFTATVFKVRSDGLPSALKRGGEPAPLPIPDDTDIGECMCFAYVPKLRIALVHYSHHGARHTALADFLKSFDACDGPLAVSPIIRKDYLDKFTRAKVFGRVEYAFNVPVDTTDLKGSGGSLSHFIDGAADLGAAWINVTVAIEASKQSNKISSIKKNVLALLNLGDKEVTTLKVDAAESESEVCEKLDLLHARYTIPFDVPSNGRYFNRGVCQRVLHDKLQEAVDAIRGIYPDRF